MKILITGCSGFIGYHLTHKLLSKNIKVIGVDMMNDYYDINLKKKRLSNLKKLAKPNKNFVFYKLNISDFKKLNKVFNENKLDYVINLAAQAGVRDSIKIPQRYLDYNITGFLNILELSNKHNIKHLLYASTSSIYGLNKKFPLKESESTEHQIQFYAVTKKTNELMAHAWSQLYNLPVTGFRFFTVYGPWGRPDMALYKFADSIINNKPIELFNKGDHVRDFTYIDDVIHGIYSAIKKIPKKNNKNINFNTSNSTSPFKIYNLGCGREVTLKNYLRLIEKNLNKKAKIKYLPMQLGDIHKTSADITLAKRELGYNPKVNVEEGIKNFISWFKYYKKYK